MDTYFKLFLDILSKKDRATFTAYEFDLGYKSPYNCRIDYDPIEVVFVRDNEKTGILRSRNGETIFVYYNDSDTFMKEQVYEFPFLLSKYEIWDRETEKSVRDSLVFILQDIVFEDWCHEGHGFYIEFSDLNG